MSDEITLESLKKEIRREGIRGTANAHKNFPLPTRVIKELYETEPESIDLLFIASYPTSPSLILEDIAQEISDTEVLTALAHNPRTPQTILNKLSRNEAASIRTAIAGNRLISARDFENLLQDPVEAVRRALATNAGLRPHQQAQLAQDSSAAVRMSLIQNKSLDTTIAIQLSLDSSVIVRTHAITRSKVDDEVLLHWANSNIEEIQLALFSRRNMTPAVFDLLKFSPHASVRKLARNKDILKDSELLWLAESDSVEDRMFVLESRNIPASIQRILAQDPSSSVRIKLGLYSGIDNKLAMHIATNGETSVCLALSNNPNISSEVIQALCEHENIDVVKRVVYRDDLKNSHLDYLVNVRKDLSIIDHLAIQEVVFPKIKEDLAQEWIRSRKASIRAFASHALSLSDGQLEFLSIDPSHIVRAAVARNKNIPPKLLIQLEDDDHPEVVNSARKAMKQLQNISKENSLIITNSIPSSQNMETEEIDPNATRKKRGFLNQITKLFLD